MRRGREWSRRQVYEVLERERRMPIARDRAGRPIETPKACVQPCSWYPICWCGVTNPAPEPT